MPGGFDQQSAGVAVAGLGDPPWNGVARGVLARHQPEVGADRAPGQPVPVADLDGQPERGQRRDPAQAAQPVTTGVNSLSAAIAVIASSSRSRRSTAASMVRRPSRTPAAAPGRRTAGRAARVRDPGPGLPAVVDDPLPQQQFRHPVPGRHQIPAAVFAGPDQIPGRFLARRSAPPPRRSGRGAAAGPDAAASRASVLTRSPARALQLRRRRHQTLDAGRGQ